MAKPLSPPYSISFSGNWDIKQDYCQQFAICKWTGDRNNSHNSRFIGIKRIVCTNGGCSMRVCLGSEFSLGRSTPNCRIGIRWRRIFTKSHPRPHRLSPHFRELFKKQKTVFDELSPEAFMLTNARWQKRTCYASEYKKVNIPTLTGIARFQNQNFRTWIRWHAIGHERNEINVSFIGKFNASNLSAVFEQPFCSDRTSSALHSVSDVSKHFAPIRLYSNCRLCHTPML